PGRRRRRLPAGALRDPARRDRVHNPSMTRGVIATPHHLASEVGAQVLRDGGNAIDAVVAADAVLCVVYPHMTSVAGDLMAIVWPAGSAASRELSRCIRPWKPAWCFAIPTSRRSCMRSGTADSTASTGEKSRPRLRQRSSVATVS